MSENEQEDDPLSTHKMTIVTTSTTVLPRDPVHVILDKIDAELGALQTTRSSKVQS